MQMRNMSTDEPNYHHLAITNKNNPFIFDDNYMGHPAFFSLSDGYRINNLRLSALYNMTWVDRQTSSVEVKFATHNGNKKLFTYVSVEFFIVSGGVGSSQKL